MPALPLGDAGPYVAAAFIVLFALVVLYVAIMAGKLGRLTRDIAELTELVAAEDARNASALPGTGTASPGRPGVVTDESIPLVEPASTGGSAS